MGRKRRHRQPPGTALAPRATPPDPQGGHGPRNVLLLGQRSAGVRVTEDTALTLGAVYACVRVIAEGLAVLPWQVFERQGAGRCAVPDDPADWLLHFQTNPETSAFTFREVLIAHALLWGNGYAEIERDAAGRPVWLWQLTPERVTVERAGDSYTGAVVYRVRNPSRADTILPAADVFHLRGLGFDGLAGYPVVRLATRTIGLGIALDEASANMMANDSTPGGYLSHPGKLTDKSRENLRDSWYRRHAGPSNRRTMAVLEEGLEWKQMGMSPEDMELLNQRRYTPAEVCRWFRVQPHKIADLERATFSNIEEQNIEHVTDTLMPWARRLEAEADLKLFGRNTRGRRFTRLNLLALLRGNAASRVAFYLPLLDRGVFSINDVREQEDMNPIQGGELRVVQQNMQPLERATAPPAPAPGPDGTPAPAAQAPAAGRLVDVPDCRQGRPWSCGAAASWAVGDYWQVGPGTEEGWIDLVGATPAAGTDPGAIAAAFCRLGLATACQGGLTLADLAAHGAAGRPVITLVQAAEAPPEGNAGGHYVCVLGVALGQVIVQDPVSGRGLIPAPEFEQRWHDSGTEGSPEYQRFGIAVGQDLAGLGAAAAADGALPPTEPGGDEDDLPNDPGGVPGRRDEDVGGLALLPIFEEALGRIERRAAHRLEDARKRLDGEALAAWQTHAAADSRFYAKEALLPAVLALARLTGAPEALAAEALDPLLDAGRAVSARELLGAVLAACPAPRRLAVERTRLVKRESTRIVLDAQERPVETIRECWEGEPCSGRE